MRPIIIVKCYSSAVNYIHDIRELGFEPVLLGRLGTVLAFQNRPPSFQ